MFVLAAGRCPGTRHTDDVTMTICPVRSDGRWTAQATWFYWLMEWFWVRVRVKEGDSNSPSSWITSYTCKLTTTLSKNTANVLAVGFLPFLFIYFFCAECLIWQPNEAPLSAEPDCVSVLSVKHRSSLLSTWLFLFQKRTSALKWSRTDAAHSLDRRLFSCTASGIVGKKVGTLPAHKYTIK